MGNLFALCCAANCVAGVCGRLGSCLCSSRNGNDDDSYISTASNAYTQVTKGRKNSVWLLTVSVILALVYQYWLGPAMDSDESYEEWVTDRWTSGGCDYDERDKNLEDEYEETCRGNAGVYRVCMVTSLFFLILAIRVKSRPSSFGMNWGCKSLWYIAGVIGTIFLPNEIFNDTGYLQFARIGGCLFILLQQIILIDMAYQWNDSWVRKADEAEREEFGSGKKWLTRILIACGVLYGGAIACLGVMFDEFKGCASNEAFMSLTVVGIVAITVVQLLGEEGSLLTSASISAYSVYLCFMAVSKNPEEECNPLYGEDNTLAIAIASVFTVLSMTWMGWSLTVEDRLNQVEDGSLGSMAKNHKSTNSSTSMSSESQIDEPLIESDDVEEDGENNGDGIVLDEDRKENQVGIVTDDGSVSLASWEIYYGGMAYKICLAVCLLSTWSAVSLTSWGQIGSNGDAANPEVGEVSMWMIITSQWVVLSLYTWSMMAPRLFPDRDFS